MPPGCELVGLVSVSYACVQATSWCTSERARKVVVSVIVVALTTQAIELVCWLLLTYEGVVVYGIVTVVFKTMVPLAVLVINVVVACQVRRAATNAAANLGVQPHHQSTSSNSVVPTVMLIATSLIYLLLYTPAHVLDLLTSLIWHRVSGDTYVVLSRCIIVAYALSTLVFAYNFYVYLITGKQFRSELHKLFCRCF